MWQPTEAMKAWHLAMATQTFHEALCTQCWGQPTPVCAEGLRLQQVARVAHEAWVSDQYAGKAVG